MKALRTTIIVLIDDDQTNTAINISLLKSLPIVQEIIFCKNEMETLNFIDKLKKEDNQDYDINLLNLKKRISDKYNFLDVFNNLNNLKECNCKFIIISTPEFSEDLLKVGIPGLNPSGNSPSINPIIIPDYFKEDVSNTTLSGLEMVKKTIDEGNDESSQSTAGKI